MAKKIENKASLCKVLSDRGVHLEHVHNARQCSSVHYGKNIVIGQDDNGKDILAPIGSRCRVCGMRIRGFDHTSGAHHNKRVPKCVRS